MNDFKERCFKFSMKCLVFLSWMVVAWILLSQAAHAEVFWSEHAVGWAWYQEAEVLPDPVQPRSFLPADPIQAMEALQKQVKQTLDLAILNPTTEHVKNYIALQNQLSERAGRFTQVWRTVLLNFPELDYSLQHPTNTIAKQIYLDKTHQQEDAAIQKLAQHSGLFFFYRSTCPYCQRFAPIIRNFSERYGISIVPITTDGISLPEFPNSQQDRGQAAFLKVTVEPALFTVDPVRHRIIPVSYGLLSEDELRERFLVIAQAPPISGENL